MSKDRVYDRRILSQNLMHQLEAHGERQVDLVRLLKVSKSTVSAYCSGTQIPRMDKLELIARHFGITLAELLEERKEGAETNITPLFPQQNEASEIESTFNSLNAAGQAELLRYGRELARHDKFKAAGKLEYIRRYIVPAAAGYASPIEGEDYELIERSANAPAEADFCISIQGDSMEPYIPDGSLVYVKRDLALAEFDTGIFFVDGDVFCKQWCVDYQGTLHLLSANPNRQDANITISRDSSRSCICFGKVLLPAKLPQPIYY